MQKAPREVLAWTRSPRRRRQAARRRCREGGAWVPAARNAPPSTYSKTRRSLADTTRSKPPTTIRGRPGAGSPAPRLRRRRRDAADLERLISEAGAVAARRTPVPPSDGPRRGPPDPAARSSERRRRRGRVQERWCARPDLAYQGVPDGRRLDTQVAHNLAINIVRRESDVHREERGNRRRAVTIPAQRRRTKRRSTADSRRRSSGSIFMCCHRRFLGCAASALSLQIVKDFSVREIAAPSSATMPPSRGGCVRAKRQIPASVS